MAAFDDGTITSDAGGLLLRAIAVRSGILGKFARCLVDRRAPGYEDLNDHDQLRYDPLITTLCQQSDVEGKKRRRHTDAGKALAGKATLQRVESAPGEEVGLGRYHRILLDPEAIEAFFVEHFLDHHNAGCQPGQIILDLDATDDPIHGSQEGRFFRGHYGHYCHLPLYVFCEGYLPAGKLRTSDIDASLGSDTELERIVTQIRVRWPKTRIIVRGDSGFAREWLMKWCEDNHVEYLFGLARNTRLQRAVGSAMQQVRLRYASTGTSPRDPPSRRMRLLRLLRLVVGLQVVVNGLRVLS